jgi:hypothetical protein
MESDGFSNFDLTEAVFPVKSLERDEVNKGIL